MSRKTDEEQYEDAWRRLAGLMRATYANSSEQSKATMLATTEIVRGLTENLTRSVRYERRDFAGLPQVNPVEVYTAAGKSERDVAMYFYGLGLENGAKILGARIFDALTGGQFRMYADEGPSVQPQFVGEMPKPRLGRDGIRPGTVKKPPYLPPVNTEEKFLGAARYLRIHPDALTWPAIRRDSLTAAEREVDKGLEGPPRMPQENIDKAVKAWTAKYGKPPVVQQLGHMTIFREGP